MKRKSRLEAGDSAGGGIKGSCRACGGESALCPVMDCIGDELLFVDGKLNPACPFLTSFGYEHYCRWPGRLELYRREKK